MVLGVIAVLAVIVAAVGCGAHDDSAEKQTTSAKTSPPS